jgi:hypothetical protein
MLRTNRIWWTTGALITVLIFALLVAIAGQQTPGGPSSLLAAGESETLRACVVEVLEEGTVAQGEFEQLCWLLNSSTRVSCAETAGIWYHAVQSTIHLESITA